VGEHALAAPQAALISALAKGVLGGDISWNLIGWGALLGVGTIILDEMLRKTARCGCAAMRRHGHLPADGADPFYSVGALIGHYYDKWAGRQANPGFRQAHGRAAARLIVGEKLFGVASPASLPRRAPTRRWRWLGTASDTSIVIGLLLFAADRGVLFVPSRISGHLSLATKR